MATSSDDSFSGNGYFLRSLLSTPSSNGRSYRVYSPIKKALDRPVSLRQKVQAPTKNKPVNPRYNYEDEDGNYNSAVSIAKSVFSKDSL